MARILRKAFILVSAPRSSLPLLFRHRRKPAFTVQMARSARCSLFLRFLVLTLLLLLLSAQTSANQVHICVENCAQCKKMLGDFFHGQLCAENCVELEGTRIPDCQDVDSIRPYLVRAV